MINHLFKGILSAITVNLLENYRHISIQLLRLETVKSYLHGVQMARVSAIGLIRVVMVIALIGVGVLLLHAGLFILLPWSVEAKAVFALFMGLAYILIGAFILYLAMEEKTWIERSGAGEMIRKAIDQAGKS